MPIGYDAKSLLKFTILIATISIGIQAHAARFRVTLFDFGWEWPMDCGNSDDHCYSQEELVREAIKFGLSSRTNVQLLFQARSNARAKLGCIIPQVDVMNSVVSAATLSISWDAIAPTIGFLFPSRWYDWRSAQQLRDAQEASLATVFANSAQQIQHLYYNIQGQIWQMRVLHFYIDEIDRMLELLRTQQMGDRRRATDEDLAILENVKGELSYLSSFIDNLTSFLPRIATAIGLDPHIDWSQLKLEPHVIERWEPLSLLDYDDFYATAIKRSTELVNIEALIESSKNNKKVAMFDFFDPTSGNSLGFDYKYRLEIAQANINMLEIQRLATKMELSNLLHDSLNNYNDAMRSFPAVFGGLVTLPDMRDAVEQHLNDATVPLKIQKLVRYFDLSSGQALRYINGYFIAQTTRADVDRYTWNGPIYEVVSFYRDEMIPIFLEQAIEKESARCRFKSKIANLSTRVSRSSK